MTNDRTCTLRAARPEDVPTIVELIRALAEYERLLDECSCDVENMTRHLFSEKPYAEVLLAEVEVPGSGIQAAGFALYFHNFSTFLAKPGIYLEDLFVRPEFRGRGIGLALLARLAEIAVERDCGRLEWSVLKWNKPSIDFYLGVGAVPMEEWQVYRMTGEALKRLSERSPLRKP